MSDAPADTALAAAAFGYVDFGAARGLSAAALMRAAGLAEAMRADPDARVSTFAYVVLWRELLVGLPGVVLPVELARALDARALGVVGQVVQRADDLGAALALTERYSGLVDTGARAVRLERDRLVGIGISHRPEVVAMRFPIELMLAWAHRLITLDGSALPVVEVTFAHPAGFPIEPYQALFGAPVRFDAPDSAIWVRPEALAAPMAGRDPLLRRYLEERARDMLSALPAPAPPLIAQLREAIAVELATSGAELPRVARRVAMSTRTVQRRLGELGTSYQDLVDDVRAAIARRLLADRSRSIIDAAFELGYADLSSFYRAFRRWTGTTPAEWRARPT